MLRGLYTSTTAMLAQSRRMDVITNNLTNAETTGFKQDTMTTRSFSDMLISRLNDPSIYQYSHVGPMNLGVHVDQVFTDFVEGSFESTDHPTDMAIVGDGFFVVDFVPAGLTEEELDEFEPQERYTRSGSFQVDADGYLVTPDGYFVHGLNGQIQVGTADFSVDTFGTIRVGDEEIDTLRIVRFEDNSVLRKQGNTLYSVYAETDEDGEEMPAAEPEDITGNIRQFYLEASNVDIAKEMVRMMETYRSYEINQKMITMFDESLRTAVNDIARF